MNIFVVCLLGCLSLALSEDEGCTERMEHIDRCIERGYATERLINCPVLTVDNPLGPKATRKCGKSEDILVDFCNKTECADETLVTEEPVTEAPTVAPEPKSTQLAISADWVFIGGLPGGLDRVSGGSAGVWGVNYNGNIFTYVDGWQVVAGGLAHVAVGGTQVWGVNGAQAIFRYNGDNTWAHIAGGLTNLDVSENDHVWGINSAGSIFRRTGTETSENGDGWEVIEGGAVQVSVGPAGVWVVNSAGKIFYRDGTYGDPDTSGFRWSHVAGGLKWVASGDDIVVGVNANDSIFYRAGITADNPVGTEWVSVPGGLSQIDVSGRTVYGRNSAFGIFECPLINI